MSATPPLTTSADLSDALARLIVSLLDDADRRTQMGREGRSYAETTFDPDLIGDAFEAVLERAVHGERRPTGDAATRKALR